MDPTTSTPMPEQVNPTNKSSIGVVVGIVVVLLILAGFVYYARQSQQQREVPPLQSTDIQALQTQGTSDEVVAIEQDLTATDLNDIDEELNDIDRELQAAP